MSDQDQSPSTEEPTFFEFEESTPTAGRSKAIDSPIHRDRAEDAPIHRDRAEDAVEKSAQYRSINGITGGFAVAIVGIAPVFVGSNRPVFWMLWTLVIGAWALFYLYRTETFQPQRQRRIRHFQTFFAIYGVFLAFAVIQLIPIPGFRHAISDMPDASLLGILRMVGSVIFFALILEISGRTSRAHWMSWAIFYAIGLHALWSLMSLNILGDIAIWGEKEYYEGAATGFFINRNSLATFLGMGLVLGLSLTLEKHGEAQLRHSYKPSIFNQHSLKDYGRWLTMFVMVLALIATQSRAGFAATIAGSLVCVALMCYYVAPHMARRYAIIVGIFITLALVAVVGSNLLDRVIVLEQNADTRWTLYKHIVPMIFDRPLFGHGTDTFWASFERGHSLDLRSDVHWDLAHSSYLMLWFEYGLIFGSLPLIALGAICVRLLHVVDRRPSQKRAPIAALSIIVLCAIHSAVDFSLEMQANVFLFLALIAMGMGRYQPDADKS